MSGKDDIRKHYKMLRQQMSPVERASLSELICKKVLAWLEGRRDIRQVHVFLPIEKLAEVDTFPLLFKLKELGYVLYTSAIKKGSIELSTLDISSQTQFENDTWGIPQPVGARETSPDAIDLVLVPLLAYDVHGHRLGYGKGYYDGFLGKLPENILKIGLSFFDPLPSIPVEPHDIPLDFCVTPFSIHQFRR